MQAASVDEMAEKYLVSNQKHETQGTVLRIISKEPPTENAKRVQPTLEDLYLYYLGKKL